MATWLRIILAIVIAFVVALIVAVVLELNKIPAGSWPGSSGVTAGFLFFWFTRKKAKANE